MDDRYRPTTDDIRTAWYGMTRNVVSFDRWLAEVKSEAWDNGYRARPMDSKAQNYTENGSVLTQGETG